MRPENLVEHGARLEFRNVFRCDEKQQIVYIYSYKITVILFIPQTHRIDELKYLTLRVSRHFQTLNIVEIKLFSFFYTTFDIRFHFSATTRFVGRGEIFGMVRPCFGFLFTRRQPSHGVLPYICPPRTADMNRARRRFLGRGPDVRVA